jgi:hypothetical protein
MVTSISNEVCQRNENTTDVTIASNLKNWWDYFIWENYLEIGYKISNPIKFLEVLINDTLMQSIDTEEKQEWVYVWNLFLAAPFRNSNVKIEIRAVDKEYYSNSEIKYINVWLTDNIAPTISMINPLWDSIRLYEWEFFNLRFTIEDTGKVETIIFIDEVENKIFTTRRIDLPINDNKSLEIWTHKVTIESKDASGNIGRKVIDVEVMRR